MSAGASHADLLRAERLRSEAERVVADVRRWIDRRRHADVSGEQRARLDVLERVLLGSLARLSGQPATTAAGSDGARHRAANTHRQRIALIARVFDYFKTRFDQRDSEPYGEMLKAADHVVNSIHAPPFRALRRTPPAAPLLYVEPAYSPRAITREEPPTDLRTSDDVLRAVLAKLPFGVIGVPAWCANDPWHLVYCAHEVGHHLQLDLAPGLVKRVGELLKAAAAGAGYPNGGRAFEVWSKEIFADAWSVAALGPVAIDSIVELERGDDASMLVANGAAYPPAIVRIALMRELAREMGLGSAKADSGLDPEALVGADPEARTEQQRQVAAMLAVVPLVAKELVAATVDGGKTLRELASLRVDDFVAGGPIDRWTEALLVNKQRASDATLRGTRHVVAASWLAWRRASTTADAAARADALDRVRLRTWKELEANREPGTLGGGVAAAAADAIGRELGDALLALGAENLGL